MGNPIQPEGLYVQGVLVAAPQYQIDFASGLCFLHFDTAKTDYLYLQTQTDEIIPGVWAAPRIWNLIQPKGVSMDGIQRVLAAYNTRYAFVVPKAMGSVGHFILRPPGLLEQFLTPTKNSGELN